MGAGLPDASLEDEFAQVNLRGPRLVEVPDVDLYSLFAGGPSLGDAPDLEPCDSSGAFSSPEPFGVLRNGRIQMLQEQSEDEHDRGYGNRQTYPEGH